MKKLSGVILTLIVCAFGLLMLASGAGAQEAAEPVKAAPATQLALSLYDMLAPAILALTAWLSLYLKTWIQAHTKNALVAGILSRFNDSVFSAVKKIENTLKAKIMAAKDPASPGGAEITADEAKGLTDAVLDELKAEYAGWGGIKEFLSVLGLGNVEQWVATRIEAAVHDVGLAKTAAGSAAAAPLS